MRDRLIELISQVQYMGGLEAKLADRLLAEGVIVPPCKVGQKVYVMESEFTGFWECKIISMLYDGVQWLGQLTPLSKLCHGSRWKWQEAEFGKTTFFTREEAEKALERSENGK